MWETLCVVVKIFYRSVAVFVVPPNFDVGPGPGEVDLMLTLELGLVIHFQVDLQC